MIYPWQKKQWQQVRQQYEQHRLPHALLLTGSPGLGKQAFGKALAALVLCEKPSDQACGQCRQCRLFEHHTHPDYFLIEPQEKSRMIKIDQVRTLIQALTQTPQIAQYQVAILHPLDALNIKAANALLKMLEEPPGNVIFILVADSLGTVPITILSRCQALHFYLEEKTQAAAWLSEALPEAGQADLLLRLAENAPLMAKMLAEQDVLALRNRLLKKLLAIADQDDNPISDIEAWLKGDISLVLMLLRVLMQDLSKCHLSVSQDKLVNIDCYEEFQRLARVYDQACIQSQIASILETERVLKRGIHINPQLALEHIMLGFGSIKI